MAQKPETVFRKRVRADLLALKQRRLPLYFDPIQQKAIKGSPDFYLCVNGLFMGLELKDENGIVSAVQDAKLKDIAASNGMAWVADRKSWPNVLGVITLLLENANDEERNDSNASEVKPDAAAAQSATRKKPDIYL